MTPRLLLLSGLAALLASLAYLTGSNLLVIVVAVVLGCLVAMVLSEWLVQRALTPLQETAERLAGGDFAARAHENPDSATGRLAGSLNRMASHVQQEVSAAAEERSRLAAALNSSIDAVASLDRDGRILFVNIGFERTFGVTSEAVLGRPLVWALADEQIMAAIRDSRDRGQREINIIERPGRRYLQVVTTPITGGGEWNVLIVCHDITEVKRTELVRRDFVANVSHELRTPLASIKAVVETLEEGALEDTHVAREFLRRADQEVDRLVLLVEELLELSRIESGEQPLAPEDTDIGVLVHEVGARLRSQAERADVMLQLEVHNVGHANVDAARIERAVLNLVHNAIKFTPAGGSVTVAAQRLSNALQIQVTDTGIGLDKEDVPRIFERFYKVDQSRASVGSGLGLALVKHAVEAHGGTVGVYSVPGEGSSFTIEIPLYG